jgi:hypothetical protein
LIEHRAATAKSESPVMSVNGVFRRGTCSRTNCGIMSVPRYTTRAVRRTRLRPNGMRLCEERGRRRPSGWMTQRALRGHPRSGRHDTHRGTAPARSTFLKRFAALVRSRTAGMSWP